MHFVALFILMLQPADPSIYRSHDFLSVRRLHCDVPVTRIILSNSNMHLSLVSAIPQSDDDRKGTPPPPHICVCLLRKLGAIERAAIVPRAGAVATPLQLPACCLHLIATPPGIRTKDAINEMQLYLTDILQVLNRGWLGIKFRVTTLTIIGELP